MNTNDNRQNAHNEIDPIFKDLFPTRNMAERPEQVALCHRMLDAMLDDGIALCDAGTGIGKTYAYLVAGTVYSRFRAVSGLKPKPILVSTSSIALQNAVRGEYLPLLSGLLLGDGIIAEPLQAVIRKGKSHYVCEERLERRLSQLDLQKKNWKAGAALLTLRGQLDMSEAAHLSNYDRERVCVPRTCDCQQETCRYLAFLEDCHSEKYLFQICNHNLLLADAIHRGSGRRPILPDTCALIVDEAHKLPETARQMFGVTLAAEDIRALTHSLQGERFLLAAEVLSDSAKSLLRKLNRPPEGKPFDYYRRSLAAPERSLTVIHRQLHGLLTPATRRQLDSVSSAVSLFHQGHPDMVFYIEEDTHGGTMLCATIGSHDGWELVDIYADEAVTGTRMDKREDFNRMMDDCRKGRIDKVLVKSISRFARNTKDCLAALRELMSLGVTVYFEKENINTETLTTELMVSVSGALAQQESVSIGQNQRQSYKRRMERGEFITCKAPYRYRLKDGKNLEICTEEAAVIRMIFTRYLSGKSTEEIADELTAMGLRTRDGKEQWNVFSITYILRNDGDISALKDKYAPYMKASKLSKFVCKLNNANNGLTIDRISRIYKYIFIDEIQDLAGYDLEIIQLFSQNSIYLLMVGDPRQVTYHTHEEAKNKKYCEGQIEQFIRERNIEICIDKATLNVTHHNEQHICEYANSMYPEFMPCSA